MTISRETFDPTKRYKRLRFHEDRDLLDSELNEAQDIGLYERQQLFDVLFAQGAIIDGLAATVDGAVVTVASGRVYVDGHLETVPGTTLTFDPEKTTGEDRIWLEVLRMTVDANRDPMLVNPLTGEPTAEREQWVVSLQARETAHDPLPAGALGRTTVALHTFDRTTGVVTPITAGALGTDDKARLNAHLGHGGVAQHPVASSTEAGFMSPADKVALVNHLGVGGSQHPVATTETAGFLSPTDKVKLDGIQAGAKAGGRFATLVVAAVNASATSKAAADYICDGVDDQTELNAARIALQALGGGKLVLTEGTFTLSNTLKLCSNLLIEGQGQATVLKVSVPQTFNWGMLTTSDSVDPNPKNITIRDLAFDGSRPALPPNSNGASAIHFGGIDGGLLENLDAAHFQYAGTAIYVAGCTNVVVRNCRSHDNDGCGIMLHSACRHCLVEGNVFYRNGIHGISLAIACDCAIVNNMCWNNGQAADNSYANIYVGHDIAWCNLQGNICRYHDTAVRPKAGIEIVNGTNTIKNLVTNNDLLNGGVIPFLNNDPETVTAAGNRVGSY